CSDFAILSSCIISLKYNIRDSSYQKWWWNSDIHSNWRGIVEQVLSYQSIPDVAFSILLLEQALNPLSFSSWWRNENYRIQWRQQVCTNNPIVLAQCLLQLRWAILPSAYYPDWDKEKGGWERAIESVF